jgi:hypothetical protein
MLNMNCYSEHKAVYSTNLHTSPQSTYRVKLKLSCCESEQNRNGYNWCFRFPYCIASLLADNPLQLIPHRGLSDSKSL